MATDKRRRICPEGLHIVDLPDCLLVDVAAYLSKPSRALFAAAMTAPSASWRKRRERRIQPSATSKMITSPPDQWRVLDFVDIDESLAKRLTDDDIGAILACIDATQTIKSLKLTGCVNIVGHGLASLRWSTRLEQIDLSLVEQHGWPNINQEPLISEAAVLPVLDSIIDADNCSLKQIQFPKKWRKGANKFLPTITPELRRFLERFNQLCANRTLNCSKCNTRIEGVVGDWMVPDNGYQNYICYSCTKYICDDCEEDYEPNLCFCNICEKDYCKDCVPTAWCAGCEDYVCEGCGETSSCDACWETFCDGCGDTCNVCDRILCYDCGDFRQCEGKDCEKQHCGGCFDGENNNVEMCDECYISFCAECQIVVCEKSLTLFGEVCLTCKNRVAALRPEENS